MPYLVVDLPPMTVSVTSSADTALKVGALDDASNILVFMASSAGTLTSAGSVAVMQVSQFDPVVTASGGRVESSQWFNISTQYGFSFPASSGTVYLISPVTFRGLRIFGGTSAATVGEIVARITKQITV